MATKSVDIPGVGSINLYKRKGARNIRLSVTGTGLIRVTLPAWVPYAAGVEFAKSKSDWLAKQARPKMQLSSGHKVGKLHTLSFEPGASSLRTRVTDTTVLVRYPSNMNIHDENVQQAALKASVRALKNEAEALLPGRLRALAKRHEFDFRSVEVRQLKSRWGSCNSRREITLNCYLMQLPWHLIDYVLLHELMHTRIMAHGPRFWAALSEIVDNLPEVRKDMRAHRPILLHETI